MSNPEPIPSPDPELAALLRSLTEKSGKGDTKMKLGDLSDDMLVSSIDVLRRFPELTQYRTLGDLRRALPSSRAKPLPRGTYDPAPKSSANHSSTGTYDPQNRSYDPTAPTPTNAQYLAFDAIFEHFNRELFKGALPPAMLAFAHHKRSLGYYIHERWHRPGENQQKVGEIALNPEHLASDERSVASTVVHEMVHLWQFSFGNPSRRGYHNDQWAARMVSVGLMPSDTGAAGGKRTGQRMTHYVIEGGAFVAAYNKLPKGALLPFVSGSGDLAGKPAKKKQDNSKLKYTCSVCGDNRWGKRIEEGDEPLVHGRHGIMVLAPEKEPALSRTAGGEKRATPRPSPRTETARSV